MTEVYTVYKEMISIAEKGMVLSDTLDICRILASVLTHSNAIGQLSIPVLASSTHVSYFTNIIEMLEWLKRVVHLITQEVNLTDVDILLPSEGTRKSLDVFNTTHDLVIVSESECLMNLGYLLDNLWLITRSKQSYYTRILNPSLVHVYNYLLVYIRIMENEQR